MLNTRNLFDSDEFSDIQIKVGGKIFKCHKIVLCRNSEYFKALCGPNSNFKESTQSIIELHDDDPSAVEAVLRQLYGFPYKQVTKIMGIDDMGVHGKVLMHMNVSMVAAKYLHPNLQTRALEEISSDLTNFASNKTSNKWNTTEAIEVLHLLMSHNDQHAGFGKAALELVELRLSDFFEDADFRQLIETEPWKEALQKCKEAMQRGDLKSLENVGHETDFNICLTCDIMWCDAPSQQCFQCGRTKTTTRSARYSWLD